MTNDEEIVLLDLFDLLMKQEDGLREQVQDCPETSFTRIHLEGMAQGYKHAADFLQEAMKKLGIRDI